MRTHDVCSSDLLVQSDFHTCVCPHHCSSLIASCASLCGAQCAAASLRDFSGMPLHHAWTDWACDLEDGVIACTAPVLLCGHMPSQAVYWQHTTTKSLVPTPQVLDESYSMSGLSGYCTCSVAHSRDAQQSLWSRHPGCCKV